MLVRRGEVSRTHQLSTDGGTSWQTAATHPEVFELDPVSGATGEKEQHGIIGPAPKSTAVTWQNSPAGQSWYYAEGEKQIGPVSLSDLKQLFRVGQLQRGTQVWTDRLGDQWVDAEDIPELASVLPQNRKKQTLSHEEGKRRTADLSSVIPVTRRLRFWTMFAAVFGLVLSAIEIIVGVILIAVYDKGRPGLFMVLRSLVPASLSWLLAWASVRMNGFVERPSERQLIAALGMLRVFWTYLGVLICLLLVAFAIGIAFSIATGQAVVTWWSEFQG